MPVYGLIIIQIKNYPYPYIWNIVYRISMVIQKLVLFQSIITKYCQQVIILTKPTNSIMQMETSMVSFQPSGQLRQLHKQLVINLKWILMSMG